MKVLIVTNMYPDASRPYNGIFVAEQVTAMQQMHPDVSFGVCFIDGGRGKQEYLKSIFSVNGRLRHEAYDLVHIHFGLSGMYLFSPFTPKVPTLVTFHGSDIQPKGGNGFLTLFTSRHAAKCADMCITLNEEMDGMVKQFCSETHVLPCAVNTDLFWPMRQMRHTENICVVFPCNRGMKVKNYPLFAEVMSLLRNKYGINCVEKELDGLSRPQVAELFNRADVLLMTSNSEGSPQAVKEALACNLPVVSTPVGDVRQLLDGVKDCFVSEHHDAGELAALVARSLQHDGVGICGEEKIRQMKLDSVSVTDKLYGVYNRLYKKYTSKE